ncbi:Rne/Rng family ribonuclease [Pajaroellobacter abortibovis]|uniref:Rne/Rng family ribonuclease n=1 Tax=Pajaroellobacter abortibovis TaxID=1882918 RepID=UPI00094AA7C6|nr:Rne/Rng family ribonuclease [Pajaroellobacter abortibovis]
MSKNLLVISVDVRETRVALIEDGIIVELHIERRGYHVVGGSVGDVYLGKVTRVLPGLQAAFVDVGLERASFLHVEDLIRPDDFDAYLAGGRKHAHVGKEAYEETDRSGQEEEQMESVLLSSFDIEDSNEMESLLKEEESLENCHESEHPIASEEPEKEELNVEAVLGPARYPLLSPSSQALFSSEEEGEALLKELEISTRLEETREPLIKLPKLPELWDLDTNNLPGFTITDIGEPIPQAKLPRLFTGDRQGEHSKRTRGRFCRFSKRDSEASEHSRWGGKVQGGDKHTDGMERCYKRRRSRDPHHRISGERSPEVPTRLSRSTPIQEVVREGDEIIVQITKEPIGTKGARCSSHISLPGRYVVYLPTVDHIGVSKRIGSEKERARLREAIESMKPPTGGLIVRTVAEGLTKKKLKQDVGYLVRLWGEIAKNREGMKAPTRLWSELDLVLKAARDLFTDEVSQIVIDEKAQHERLVRFVEMFIPERARDVVYYSGEEPIFDAYGIEDEIARALSRKVPLPSGGYLIIDQAEALTAIDVNTGRFVGKGSKDMEETILKTNIEAVYEIAYQLRFRNIGGLIILDIIDMEKPSNREKVYKTLEEVLQKDKAKTTLIRISELGLIEMTRKRTRESLGRLLHEPCFYCDGTGRLQSKETIAYEILREIRRKRNDLPGYTITVHLHPTVAELLTGPEKSAVQEIENRYMRKINVSPRKDYHLEQFDLQGK